MSRWWRDRLCAGLCPGRVLLERRPRRAASVPHTMELPVIASVPGPAWTDGLNALEAHLSTQKPPAELSIVLSSHFVRYAVLPWQDQLNTTQEWEGLASHAFSRIHGQAVNHWHVRVSHGPLGQARIASAIDKALLDRIEALCAGLGVRLLSVMPYLMLAFNRAMPALTESSFWFAVPETGCCTLGLIEEGQWRVIRTRKTAMASRPPLAELIHREALMSSREDVRKILVSGNTAVADEDCTPFEKLSAENSTVGTWPRMVLQ